MSDLPLLAVNHERGSASPYQIMVAAEGLCRLVFLVDGTQARDEALLTMLRDCGPVLQLDPDPAQTARSLEKLGVDALLTYSDYRVSSTARLAALMGLPYHSEGTARALTRKDVQRTLLREGGADDTACVLRTEPLETFGPDLPLPAVVKPATGAASRHTYLANTPAECARAVRAVLEGVAAADRPGAVVEQLLVGDTSVAGEGWGDHVSVESMVRDGRAEHYAVIGKFPLAPPFRETGHFAPATISAGTRSAVLDLTTRALKALDVRHGATHTEIKLTPAGPRVIEVNGRLGGFVDKVLSGCYAVSPLRSTIAAALGHDVRLEPGPPAGVSFVYSPPAPQALSRMDALHGLDVIRSLDGVREAYPLGLPGRLLDWRDGSGSALADVWGVVEDHERLRELVLQIEAALRLEHSPARD
ncbi:ATP-grasp domain-containing protein [Nonomuraea sp. NPDC049725]|uniref:ATP-grasp domain-containing protein n=1 Tax=Nonomuraea sp. NPDC049725 TaxID=3154508 RepID=UPI0034367977